VVSENEAIADDEAGEPEADRKADLLDDPAPIVQPKLPAIVAARVVAMNPARLAWGRRVSKSFACILHSRCWS